MGCVQAENYIDESGHINIQKTVKDPQQYPYNCIGLLFWETEVESEVEVKKQMSSGNEAAIEKKKQPYVGTGFLIGPNLVLTAAHNLFYGNQLKGRVTNISFYPGLDGDVRSVYQQSQISVETHSKPSSFQPHQLIDKGFQIKAEHDFALILLPNEIVRDHYIVLGYNFEQISQAMVCGYPIKTSQKQDADDKICFYKQTKKEGKITQFKQQNIFHDVQTFPGSSGSPIMVKFQQIYFAVGIHCKKIISKDSNVACTLSQQKVLTIKRWAQELIEAHRNNFPQQFQRYINYVQATLCMNMNHVFLGEYKGNIGKQKLIKQLQSLQQEIQDQRNLINDYQSLHNIVSYSCQAAQIQIQLQLYEKAEERLKKCLRQLNGCSKATDKQQNNQQNKQQNNQQDNSKSKEMPQCYAKIYTKLGYVLQLLQKKQEAIKLFHQAKQVLKNSKVKVQIASVYQQFAMYSIAFNQTEKALKYYRKAKKLVKQHQKYNIGRLANLSMNIGNVLSLTKSNEAAQQFKKAIQLYGKVLQQCLQNDSRQLRQDDGTVIATIHGTSALKVYFLIGCCHYNLGKYLLAQEKCNEALSQFKQAFDNFLKAQIEPDQHFQNLVAGFANSLSKYIKSKIQQKLKNKQPVAVQDRQTILNVISQVLAMFQKQPVRLRSLLQLFRELQNGRTQRIQQENFARNQVQNKAIQ